MSSQPIIVITGSTGTTGRDLVKLLSQVKDVKVRATVHSLQKAKELPEGVEVVQMECEKPETMVAAFTGATKLYLLPPSESNRDRAKLAPMLVEAALKAGIQHIVLISAFGIDREPILATDQELYGHAEAILARSGTAYTILRPTWFNQNFISPKYFILQVQQGLVPLPVGEGRAAWIDTRDIAAVAAKVLTQTGHENKVYNLTGPKALTMNEVTAILSQVAGREIKFINISEESFAQVMKNRGFSEVEIQRMLDILRKLKIGSHDVITQDVEQVTGKKPISFEQFAIDHAYILRQLDPSRQEALTRRQSGNLA